MATVLLIHLNVIFFVHIIAAEPLVTIVIEVSYVMLCVKLDRR